jgi:hypothetical protein
MGSLTPGATYVYERSDGVIYAREVGTNPDTRFVVGYESPQDYDRATGVKEEKVWKDIRHAAKTDPKLQEALERVKILYELSKK